MAKFVFGEGLDDYGWLEDFFDLQLSIGSSSETSVTFDDAKGGQIIVSGTGLTVIGGSLTGGKIAGVQFIADGGATLLTITGGKYTAADLTAGSFFEIMSALSRGNDTLIGTDGGNDFNVVGDNHGNDTIIAGDGGSFMAGSEGRDTYKGGADWDTLSFEDTYYQADAKRGVIINAAKGTITDSWGDKDKFSAIEELRGSVHNDKITGTKADESFAGVAGKDSINGGAGWDDLRYHRDAKYDGGDHGIAADLSKGVVTDGFGDVDKVKNIEAVYGTAFADSFIGNAKDNQFRGLAGSDSFNGGEGFDEVNFDFWEDLGQHGISVNMTLATGQVVDDGFGNTETLVSIEAIGGTTFSDTIRLGSEDSNAYGNDGDDTFFAGTGVQQFYGDAGADKFVFESLATVGLKPERDYIDDFNSAEGDKIDLSGIVGLVFKGSGDFGGEAGELRVIEVDGFVALSADMDGDKVADFQIIFGNTPTISQGDVLL